MNSKFVEVLNMSNLLSLGEVRGRIEVLGEIHLFVRKKVQNHGLWSSLGVIH
jgi:hypothetical protein